MGILANSASVTMTSSASDDVASGFVTGESIALTTNPTGTSYEWTLGRPEGSTTRARLVGDTSAPSVTFTPDAGGIYVITCTVDGSIAYVLRVSAERLALSGSLSAQRFMPVGDAAVPTPALGATVFYSRDSDALAVKLASGEVRLLALQEPEEEEEP